MATAQSLKAKGNAAYALGELSQALELFTSASALDPTSPILLSNASATLYELGRYDEALDATEKAIKLEEAAESSRSLALAAKLALRRVRILIQLRRYDDAVNATEGVEGVGELAQQRKLAIHLASIPPLPLLAANKIVLSLPVSRATHRDVVMDYYAIGHDIGASALSLPPTTFNLAADEARFKLQLSRKEPVSCVIGGAGEGRHAIATAFEALLQVMLAEEEGVKTTQAHVMLVDLSRESMARLFLLFSFLYDVGMSKGPEELNPLLAVLHYFYVAAVMPASVHEDLLFAIRRARSRLTGSLPTPSAPSPSTPKKVTPLPRSGPKGARSKSSKPRPKPSASASSKTTPPPSEPWTSPANMPPWLHFDPIHYPSIIAALDFWLDPRTAPPEVTGRWMDKTHAPESKAARGNGMTWDGLGIAQYEVLPRLKILVPSRWTLDQEPPELVVPLESFMRRPNEADAEKVRKHVRKNWRANPVMSSSLYPSPSMLFDDPFGTFFKVVAAYHVAPDDDEKAEWDRLHDHTDWSFGMLGKMLALSPRAVKFELVFGEVFGLLESIQLGTETNRDKSFPTTWDRIWLSNIPDYIGGMVFPMTQLGLLKPLPTSFVTFYCLLNTRGFPSCTGPLKVPVNSASLTYLGVPIDSLPTYFGGQFQDLTPPIGFADYAIFSPCPTGKLLSRSDLAHFIQSTFLRLALPSRNRSSLDMQTVREPLNLASLFRILRRLHEIGYPSHYISDALLPILSNSLVTRARPPPDKIPLLAPVPLSPAIPISTAPFLPELIVAASVYHHSLPFPIPSLAIIPLSKIGQYRLSFKGYRGGPSSPTPTAPTLVLMFTKDAMAVDYDQEKGAVDGQSRILRGGRSANSLILQSSLSQSCAPDDRMRDMTFAMPSEVVEKLWREKWSVRLLDCSGSFLASEDIVCGEKTLVYVGSLGGDILETL